MIDVYMRNKIIMSLQRLPSVAYKNNLQRQQIAQRMFNHRKRLCQLDTKRPRQHSEIILQNYRALHDQNPKRDYYLQTKYTQIQRQNRLLFEKISNIKRNKKRSRDNLPRMKSLNTTFRRKQVQEIEIENARMYNRLIKQKPSISFKATDRDFHENKKRVERLSKQEKYKMQDWY